MWPWCCDVRGAHGWQVNGHGHLYKHMRRKYPYAATGGMPVIYLGEQYCGPLLPAYDPTWLKLALRARFARHRGDRKFGGPLRFGGVVR